MNNVKKQLRDCNIIKYIVSSKIVDLWEYVLQPIFLLGTRSLLPCGQNFPGSNKYVIRKPCNLIIKLATAFRQTHRMYWQIPWVFQLYEGPIPHGGIPCRSSISVYSCI